MMRLALFLARRLSLSSRSKGGGAGVFVAVTGIALAMVVMMLSVSIMMGFRDEIRSKVMGFDSQITIVPQAYGASASVAPLVSKSLASDLEDILPPEASLTLTVRQPAILKTPENFSGAVIKGLDNNFDHTFLKANLVEGTVPDFGSDSTMYHIVISKILAGDLGLDLGDRMDTYFLGNNSYRVRRLKIAGIYDTHFTEYDRNMVFATLPMLAEIGDIPDGFGTLMEINGLKDDAEIDRVSTMISNRLLEKSYSGTGENFTVLNIHDTASLFFNWLALLDTNVTVILALMSILAALTLVSSMFILVLRRVASIGLLKALGASDRLVRNTFILLTAKILIRGLAIGNLIALALIGLQAYTGVIPLDPEAYYLDHVPVALSWGAVIVLNAAAITIAIAVLIVPSAIISTIKPSRAISYE